MSQTDNKTSIAIMATFPARKNNLEQSLKSIATQVDVLYVVLNEYTTDLDFPIPSNVRTIIPPTDLKDTGKFYIAASAYDYCFLCDDDVIYPPDYCRYLIEKLEKYSAINAIVGLHGIVYSDFFDGVHSSRCVYNFTQKLDNDTFVNVIATNALACRGWQMPPFDFMKDSAKFVDVRFNSHCVANNFPRICVSRIDNWMAERHTGSSSIFETFTTAWPSEVTKEALAFSGFGKI